MAASLFITAAALARHGGRAWRLSPWLDRLLPDLDLEGHRLARAEPQDRPADQPADELVGR